ncbi:anti-sigma factor [Novosphingobium sp. FSW06-99]|uniref:anti-sigma factor family protein n=1 Tax=Novosphingobium sp. FSW06-99 TaxID=1739113 RepID=UPI00076C1884|nr:anti-sigma factor [Novosphingobium sp. FSW06-99]KUR79046.1 hypothetical protein AQZ49_06435 [Novosphingobium sp. FSW06-99]
MTERPVTEADLQAYVDDRLAPPDQCRVEAYLAEHPEAQQRIDALIVQRHALRAALAPIADEPVPSRLDIRHFASRRRPAVQRPTWQALAASVALLAIGAMAGWQIRDHAGGRANGIGALAQEAADSYAVYASDRQHPVEIAEPAVLSQWISRRIHRLVGVPSLDAVGFRLLGGRVVATPHGPAGFYVYEGAQGMRLGVLVRPMTIDKTAKMAEHDFGGVSGFAWADRGLGYSVIGTASASAIHPLAGRIRQQSTAMSTIG